MINMSSDEIDRYESKNYKKHAARVLKRRDDRIAELTLIIKELKIEVKSLEIALDKLKNK